MRFKGTFGWLAILINSLFASIWSYWGIIENFHEGWYYDSWLMNVGLMLIQYLSFALTFIALGAIAIKWNKIGGLLFIIFGILIPFKFNTSAAFFIFSIPMTIGGIFYFVGRIQNKWLAYSATVYLPIIIMFIFSIEPIYRISARPNNDSPESIVVNGNQVELMWAPAGPGWPTKTQELTYKSWDDVVWICAHLSEDGKTISDSTHNIWRLPTVDEVTRSLTRNGKNAGGIWYDEFKKGIYQIKPDKEPPLWKAHSPIIYWWTSSEVNETTVFRVVYNGSVQEVNKNLKMGSLGFRAVKQVR